MSLSVDETTYEYEEPDGSGYYSKHGSQLTPAKTVLLHRNGDRFFVGRKFVVNRRHVPTFEHFLMEVTRRVPLDLGAAQRIYTPRQGHRVRDLEGLQQGQVLVAAGKESFKKIDYFQIAPRKSEIKKDEVIKPVVHSRIVVSSKWANYQRDSCTLNVFKNGDMLMPPVRMLLSKHMLKDWNRALAAISEKVHPSVGAVQRLYTIDGHRVSPGEIENNQYYVAVGREKFKRLPYHHWLPKSNQANALRPSAHSLGSVGSGVSIRGRRYGTRLMQQRKGYHRSAQQAQSEGRKKGQSEHGSVHSFGDDESDTFFKQVYQDPHFTDKEDTSVCNETSKQSKHSIDLPPSMTNHDRGVFRACASRDEIHGAAEVQEDKQIKIELPIDQVSAEVVEEEEIPVNLQKTTHDTADHEKKVPLHSDQGSNDSTHADEKNSFTTIAKQANYLREHLLMEKALKEHMAFEKQPVIPYTAMKACLVLGRVVLGNFCSKIMASPARFLVLPPSLEASHMPLILQTSVGAIASRRLTLPSSSAATAALVFSPPSLGKMSAQLKPTSSSGVSSTNASVVSPPS